jgi:hypothetical protein
MGRTIQLTAAFDSVEDKILERSKRVRPANLYFADVLPAGADVLPADKVAGRV